MPLNSLYSRLVEEQSDERVSALERQVQELRETVDLLNAVVTISAERELIIDAETIRLVAENEIEIRAGNTCQVSAMSMIEIDSSGRLMLRSSTMENMTGSQTVNAAITNFSGMIRCSTIQADTVIGSSYTPGAGNLM